MDYKMIVANFSRLSLSDRVVIGEAIATLAQTGNITLNIPYRIRRVFGHQLSVANRAGGHASIALFYNRKRLYQVQGTVLP